MEALSKLYGRLLNALMGLASLLLMVMCLIICGDVFLRNLGSGAQGLPWSNEISELFLYFITMLTAPWLLRQGQHIRVDVLLRAVPHRLAWIMEWIGDILGLACSLLMLAYSWRNVAESVAAGSQTIKTLILPEWWSLAPLPAAFALLAIEFVFRMHRLYHAKHGPRSEAVSAA